MPTRPVLHQQGFAVFSKLWNFTEDSSAEEAYYLFSSLDTILLAFVEKDETKWFPSPYGGAIITQDVNTALYCAEKLSRELTKKKIQVSIAIAKGYFSRVDNVNRWNVSSLSLNIAARMTALESSRGRVFVSPEVKTDIEACRGSMRGSFGEQEKGVVKNTEFSYFQIIHKKFIQQNNLIPPIPERTSKNALPIKNCNIVMFDIVKYSNRKPEDQIIAVTNLSKAIELALATVNLSPIQFEPAGDGGYIISDLLLPSLCFAKLLQDYSDESIRVSILNGPIVPTDKRKAVGSVILKADDLCSRGAPKKVVFDKGFFNLLSPEMKNKNPLESYNNDLFSLKIESKSIQPPVKPSNSPINMFPWPLLLRRAMDILFSICLDKSILTANLDTLRHRLREMSAKFGAVGEPDIQVSAITNDRHFAYHDQNHQINRLAEYFGDDLVNIYDSVFMYPHGAVAWVDHTTNVPGAQSPLWRLNIAVFSALPNSEIRIIVEIHHEMP